VSVHPWHDVPLSPDGDPLDVLVLCREALVPGTLLRARAVGVMRMRDEKGQDDKLMAVPVDDPEHASYRDVADLPPHRLRELRRFFLDYKVLEGEEVTFEEPLGAAPTPSRYSRTPSPATRGMKKCLQRGELSGPPDRPRT
jgi:inorganic pyrophosphatase